MRLFALALLSALVLAACGSPPVEEPAVAIGTGEAALADNAAQADRIVGSGKDAYEARLAALEGHPVVVNQWASWCSSCRFEFPFFKAATEEFAGEVAFLGLDSQDSRSDAEEFQREVPAGFPSIFDGDASVARDIGGGTSWPTTFFYDADGDLAFTKIGAYATQELLFEDIRRHALGAGT